MRALIFLSVIALANYYITARLFAFAPIEKHHFIVPVVAALLLFSAEMLDLRSTFLQTYPWLKLAFSLITGTFFCLFFYVFVADVILLLTSYWAPPNITTWLFWGIIGVTVVTVTIGAFQAAMGPSIKNVEVYIENLPPAFEDYKIVQITDLHVGGTIRKAYVQNVVNLVNSTNADLIALTGDMADGTVTELKNDSALLANMKSKDGIYFITGNHEYYHDVVNWLPYYKQLGFHILANKHEMIERDGAKLVIAGVNDYSTRYLNSDERSDISRAASGIPENAVKILLMHQPTLYKEAEQTGFDLQLSGHTHGGQFFPWTLVIPLFHHFAKGLNHYKHLQVYVSVGTGYWGPSLRTFCPSEITVLTLKRAKK